MYRKDSMCEGTSDLLCALTMGPGPTDLPARRVDQTAPAFLLCIRTNFIKDREYSHRKHCRSHWSRTQKSLIIEKECKNRGEIELGGETGESIYKRLMKQDNGCFEDKIFLLFVHAEFDACFTEYILHVNVPNAPYEVNINCIINIYIYNQKCYFDWLCTVTLQYKLIVRTYQKLTWV